ncbi:MAG TPA: class I SAM-dependent methyltransferase [Rhodothermales bacterium]|nr:class I SAM-dependent methyltransferase [Rhodothermales bacterium]
MKEGQASHTAERVAIRRAAHQLLDDPKVLDDPLALRVIPPETAAHLRERPREFDRSPLSKYMRAFMAVRSRFAEDQLHEAIARGIQQYVVLGAGLDTFAYRNPYPSDVLHVFEVDHPDTQRVKRARLAEAGIAVPDTATYVPVDFTRDALAPSLAAAGFDPTAPAFFAWLGVVPYLPIEDVRATLSYIASLPPGTTVVFDYGEPPESLNWFARKIFERMAARVAAAGEPFVTFFDPSDLLRLLRDLGFHHAEDFGPDALNARYFVHRKDGLKVGARGRMALASV